MGPRFKSVLGSHSKNKPSRMVPAGFFYVWITTFLAVHPPNLRWIFHDGNFSFAAQSGVEPSAVSQSACGKGPTPIGRRPAFDTRPFRQISALAEQTQLKRGRYLNRMRFMTIALPAGGTLTVPHIFQVNGEVKLDRTRRWGIMCRYM